jgi:hypothetical protein
LIGSVVVPVVALRVGIAGAVETLCLQGVVESVFFACDMFVGIACDVVEEFPFRPFLVGPVRARSAGQAADLGDIGKEVGVACDPFEGLVSEAHEPGAGSRRSRRQSTSPA